MAFFAVWTVHNDTHENPELARTQKYGWKNIITFSMFYPLEHHLYTAVTTIKLIKLDWRIDESLNEIKKSKPFHIY